MRPVRWRAKLSDIAWPLALCLIALFFGAQAFRYSGIVGRLGEWQFNGLDVYYPGLTVFVLLALVMVPVVLVIFILRGRKRRRERLAGDEPPPQSIERRYLQSIGYTSALIRSLYFLAAAAGVGVLVCILIPIAIDNGGGAARIVDAAEHVSEADLPAKLNGRIDSHHIALLRQGIGFAHNDVYVAPLLVADAHSPPNEYRYFAEVAVSDHDAGRGGAVSNSQTYLRRTSLPLQLASLYRSRGIAVPDDAVILFSSRYSRDWPYYIAAIQLCVLALLAAILAGVFQWRRRRLSDRMAGLALPANRITRR